MSNIESSVGVAVLLLALAAAPLPAQTASAPPDPMVASILDGAAHLRSLFTTAAGQMSEEDYAFRPTPEVRSFAELLAHVAESSAWCCATAMGEAAPRGGGVNGATRAGIQRALAQSFDACDRAYAAMADAGAAAAMRDLMGERRPALAVLNFRNYHTMLHWGNTLTYMRLRGKVAPSN